MTIGIYALYWEQQDLIYIGQSQNIEARIKRHVRNLVRNKHSNYKVTEAYKSYGAPQTLILEECPLSKLNCLEIFWTNEFDSLHNGLNIIDPGTTGGSGTTAAYSKYSKWKVLRVFSRLVSGKLSNSEIASIEKVNVSLPRHICAGGSHIWLKEEYPDKYDIMRINAQDRHTHNTRGGRKDIKETLGSSLKLIHTNTGQIIEINNLCQDCLKYGLQQSAVSGLISGARHTHKQYKIYYGSDK